MKLPRVVASSEGGSSGKMKPVQQEEKPTVVVSRHDRYTVGETTGGLSVLFTILCIVDLFGVFPVVALPKSIIACGIYGIPLVITVFSLQLYTAVLLGRSWLLAQEITPNIREKSRFPYAAVAELAFGKHASRLAIFLIDATIFGAGIPNFIFAAQSMQLFWWKITDGEVGVSYCIWMLLIGLMLCPVMWLGSPKDMKPLAAMSVLIVLTVAFCTWACIIVDDVSPPNESNILEYRPNVQDFLVAYGIIAFQFDIHPMLLTIQVDMRDSRKIHVAALGGFAATGFLFIVTTVLAAARYGQNVESNILQGIPPSIPLFVVALLVTIQLCLSSAVGNSALFQHIEDLLKIPRNFSVQRCLVRSSIIAMAVFLGESVPRFDLVMGLVGSTLTGPLMFIFPPLFFLRLCYMKSYKQKYGDNVKLTEQSINQNGDQARQQNGATSNFPLILRNSFHNTYRTFTSGYENIDGSPLDEYDIKLHDILLAAIVAIIGLITTVIATYCSWSDTISSAQFSPPCISNITAAARSFLEVTKPM